MGDTTQTSPQRSKFVDSGVRVRGIHSPPKLQVQPKHITKPSYTYRLDLGKGRKYVGQTTNPRRRIAQHFSGRGARYTRAHKPKGVDYVKRHLDGVAARKAKAREYYQAKKEYGDKVRGAGNTKSDD